MSIKVEKWKWCLHIKMSILSLVSRKANTNFNMMLSTWKALFLQFMMQIFEMHFLIDENGLESMEMNRSKRIFQSNLVNLKKSSLFNHTYFCFYTVYDVSKKHCRSKGKCPSFRSMPSNGVQIWNMSLTFNLVLIWS